MYLIDSKCFTFYYVEYVCLGTVKGRITKPSNAGKEPTCTTDEKTARLVTPSALTVPIRLPDLYPLMVLIKLALNLLSKEFKSFLE